MLQYLLTYLPMDEEGQDLVEYALIIVLVAIALVVALGALGTGIEGVFTDITTALGVRP
jgi:pilus assembly protein Flp/PilA